MTEFGGNGCGKHEKMQVSGSGKSQAKSGFVKP